MTPPGTKTTDTDLDEACVSTSRSLAADAGHFVKMIHNAIECAMLQAMGAGFECLHRSEFD